MNKHLINTYHKMKTKLAIFVFGLFLCGTLAAQTAGDSSSSQSPSSRKAFKHAINICPIAPVFGIYAVNYEYLISPKNGLVVRFEYEAVPKAYTDANIESSGTAYTLNYRRHLSGEMNSIFLGAYGRYRTYKGDGMQETTPFDFTMSSYTFGLNGGKRWVWNSGFNIAFSLGYGFSIDDREATPTSNAIEAALDQLEKEYDFMSPFLGELSIGYAF